MNINRGFLAAIIAAILLGFGFSIGQRISTRLPVL